MFSTISNNVLSSIKNNTQQLQKNADQISKLNRTETIDKPAVNINRLLVEQRQIEANSKTSIKAFQIADATLGYLLDIKA